MKKKKIKSTYDIFYEKISKDSKKKKKFDSELRELYLSEIVSKFMELDKITVRELASISGISKSQIQSIRTEPDPNFTFKTMSAVLNSLGAELFVKKNSKYYPLQPTTD